MAQPWSTIAENKETGALSFELHIPTLNAVGEPTGGAWVIVWDEASVRELKAQLDEFMILIEERRAVEEIMAADSGGH